MSQRHQNIKSTEVTPPIMKIKLNLAFQHLKVSNHEKNRHDRTFQINGLSSQHARIQCRYLSCLDFNQPLPQIIPQTIDIPIQVRIMIGVNQQNS